MPAWQEKHRDIVASAHPACPLLPKLLVLIKRPDVCVEPVVHMRRGTIIRLAVSATLFALFPAQRARLLLELVKTGPQLVHHLFGVPQFALPMM
jgi:hypothetical protein